MLKKIIALIALSFGLNVYAKDSITLEAKNTVVLRDVFTNQSCARVLAEIIEKDNKLPKGEPIYLFLDTPGGSVVAGINMLQAIRSMDREVKTVTRFAASMGFITTQFLGERLVMPFGVLMDHRAAGGVEGQIPGEMDTRYNFWHKYLTAVDKTVADRLGISIEELRAKHINERWEHGSDAVASGLADRVVDVKCAKDLSGTYDEEVTTLFGGTVEVTWSKCPLVSAPLKLKAPEKGADEQYLGSKKVEELKDYISKRFYDKEAFLEEYIVTGRFRNLSK